MKARCEKRPNSAAAEMEGLRALVEREEVLKAAGIPFPPKRAPSHTPGKMNKTEAEYALMLEVRKRAEGILYYGFEKVTLKIGDDCRYTPDFFVIMEGQDHETRLEFHEVKGPHMRDDSLVKLKAAATQFPWATFYLCRKTKDGWQEPREIPK